MGIAEWQNLNGYHLGNTGLSARKLSLNDFSDLAWWYCTKEGDPKEVEKFKRRLWIPPKGAVIPENSPWSSKNTAASVNSLRAAVTGKPAVKA